MLKRERWRHKAGSGSGKSFYRLSMGGVYALPSCLQQREEVETKTAECVEIQENNAFLGNVGWRGYRQECLSRLVNIMESPQLYFSFLFVWRG